MNNKQIVKYTVCGKCNKNHRADCVADGKQKTYWQPINPEKEEADRRFIQLDTCGVYAVSEVILRMCADAPCTYQLYASENGRNYRKVAYGLLPQKMDSVVIPLKDIRATSFRLQLSVCQNGKNIGKVYEIKIFGEKIGDNPQKEEINIKDFIYTQWKEQLSRSKSEQNVCTEQAIYDLIGRVLGKEYISHFVLKLTDKNDLAKCADSFCLTDVQTGQIQIEGTSGVALASGFKYYMQNYLHLHYNPLFESNLNFSGKFLPVGELVFKHTEYNVRYALNFCTHSYTMAFWNKKQYEGFLDWMAMNGVNLLLDIVGQEEVIRRLLLKYGYNNSEITDYLTGPAYFAWFYMQNMTGFGGPLTEVWFEERVELARWIHSRMYDLGITPIWPGFSGMVPHNFKKKNPDATIIPQGDWCGFKRPHMLQNYNVTGRNYYEDMSADFYKIQKDLFGEYTRYFATDPLHEGGKLGGMDATKVYHMVQVAMQKAVPNAVWILQQWQGSLDDAKLAGLDKNNTLVLDLFAEAKPFNERMEKAKVPWVWNMLYNFGGRMGIDGDLQTLTQAIPQTYKNSKYMVGIGAVPEAFGNGPIMYDLLFDMAWEQAPIDQYDYTAKYIESRYGKKNEQLYQAWKLMLKGPYLKKPDAEQGAPESVVNARPSKNFRSASFWGYSQLKYDTELLEKALQLFFIPFEQFKDNPAYRYDLVDLAKQVLANRALKAYKKMMTAFCKKNVTEFEKCANTFLNLIEELDTLLACCNKFSAMSWINEARDCINADDDWTRDLLEFNARALITTWGGKAHQMLVDYSNRQWSELTNTYYLSRWKNYIQWCDDKMKHKHTKKPDFFEMEWTWVNQKSDETPFEKTINNIDTLRKQIQKLLDK